MSAFDGLLDDEGKPKYEGQSLEVSGVKNQPGLYVHPTTGAQIITTPGSKGVTQADALVRQGWERRGPVPTPQELADMRKAQLEKDHAAGKTIASAPGVPAAAQAAAVSQIADLQSQLDAAQKAQAEAEQRARDAEAGKAKAEDAADAAAEALKKAEAAKEPAAAQPQQPANTDDKTKSKENK